MSDITAGPDMFSRILASNHDEDGADIGETRKSFEAACAKVASETACPVYRVKLG